jgi:hypothetical protein
MKWWEHHTVASLAFALQRVEAAFVHHPLRGGSTRDLPPECPCKGGLVAQTAHKPSNCPQASMTCRHDLVPTLTSDTSACCHKANAGLPSRPLRS